MTRPLTLARVRLEEGPGSAPLSPQRRYDLVAALLARGYGVDCSGRGDATRASRRNLEPGREGEGRPASFLRLGEAAPATEEMRAGEGSQPSGGDGARPRRDIRGLSAGAVADLADAARAAVEVPAGGAWKPWFPVIDFDRCTNCMQCLSFCLFGVYGVDAESRIQVAEPEKCKTSCPACSRVCPEVAILFPKYGSGPINGAEVREDDVEREKMKIDVSALLGGDIYDMLRQRHQRAESRFSKERDEGKALEERLRCLKQIGGDLDVPPEVLMALPGADEIRARADEARRKAEEALRGRASVASPGDGPSPEGKPPPSGDAASEDP